TPPIIHTSARHATAAERVAEIAAEWAPKRRHEQRSVAGSSAPMRSLRGRCTRCTSCGGVSHLPPFPLIRHHRGRKAVERHAFGELKPGVAGPRARSPSRGFHPRSRRHYVGSNRCAHCTQRRVISERVAGRESLACAPPASEAAESV